MEKIFATRRFNLLAAGLLAASILAVYSNTFHAGFQFDDLINIVDNYKLRSLDNFYSILKSNRGITFLTFALNYAFGGLDVFGYHLINTLIHITNSILAYFLVLRTLERVSDDQGWTRRLAFFSALLFAVHPLQTQAVTYIVQRMESLASLFYLAAILFFIKSTEARGGVKRMLLYLAVALCYILGFYSKEIAITLPAVIVLYDLCFLRNKERGMLERWPLYAMLAFLLLYFTISTVIPLGGFNDLSSESAALSGHAVESATGPLAAPQGPAAGHNKQIPPTAGFGVKTITPKQYLYTQFNVLLYYIVLLLVPVNQNIDYDFPVSRGLFEVPRTAHGTVLNIPIPPPIVSLVVLLSIVGFALYLYRRSQGASTERVVSFFILWFFIILSPTSSFIPIIDVIFEHRVYLASLGFFVIFTIAVDGAINRLLKTRQRPAAGRKNQP